MIAEANFKLRAPLLLNTMPVPANAKMVTEGRKFDLTDLSFYPKIFYRIKQPYQELIAFYKTEMPKRDWLLKDEVARDTKDIFSLNGHWPATCMVFEHWGFNITVDVQGTIENDTVLDDSNVFIDALPDSRPCR